jgi:hypothetical protein
MIVFCCIALAACARPDRHFLINVKTASPVVEIETPISGAGCATRELHFSIGQDNTVRVEICDDARCREAELSELTFFDRSSKANPNDIRLGSGDATKGPVMPVQGPDGLLWLCREDEEAQQCICIPWFQED